MQEKHKTHLLAVAQAWLPVLTAVVGALWGLYVFMDQQKHIADQANSELQKGHALRLIEARKPFLEKQLAVYFDITHVAGELVAIGDPASKNWDPLKQRFLTLYLAEGLLVSDRDVLDAMGIFEMAIEDYKADGIIPRLPLFQPLKKLSESIHKSFENNWNSVDPSVFKDGSPTQLPK
jgi:hypothetical protein